jgi:hypothetical protein
MLEAETLESVVLGGVGGVKIVDDSETQVVCFFSSPVIVYYCGGGSNM